MSHKTYGKSTNLFNYATFFRKRLISSIEAYSFWEMELTYYAADSLVAALGF